jgi:hypothetical protein
MSAHLNGSRHSTGERLASLEQRMSHVDSELARMSARRAALLWEHLTTSREMTRTYFLRHSLARYRPTARR